MGANLKGANLSRTNLTRSKLAWANLADADLSRSLLDDAILVETNLAGARFRKARLTRAWLMGAKLDNADLVETELIDSDFGGGAWTDLVQKLTAIGGLALGVVTSFLYGSTVPLFSLAGDLLGELIPQSTDKAKSNDKARLDLLKSLREKAKTSSYLLDNDVFVNSLFIEAASLQGANMTAAKLTGANLAGANLKGATVTQDQLAQAKSYTHAIMPDGTVHLSDSPVVTSKKPEATPQRSTTND